MPSEVQLGFPRRVLQESRDDFQLCSGFGDRAAEDERRGAPEHALFMGHPDDPEAPLAKKQMATLNTLFCSEV
jgi:hypothetical protein